MAAVHQVSERAICQCTLTTGFGMEINFIWIQSDSLLDSALCLEEQCLVAAIDLQSEYDGPQTDASSLWLQFDKGIGLGLHTGRNTD